jgi:glycosyltransferase involved in cell wall biosynthesis
VQAVLFVLPGFQPSSAVSQALMAARGLLAAGMAVHVAGWGGENFITRELGESGAVVLDLGRERLLSLEHLRQLVLAARSIRPTTTIAWGLSAIRLAGLLPRRLTGRLVASHAQPIATDTLTRCCDRWLLGRLDRLIVSSATELERARKLGLSALQLIPPGIETAVSPETKSPAIAMGRYLLCVGPLERSKGLQEAIWSHQILHYVFEDLHLCIAGAGPDRQRLRHFARAIEAGTAVHFLGARSELDSVYAQAVAVWVPSQADRGARVALEAMRSGKPVVASRQPTLAEVIIDGETGLLVPKGDKVALAKQTRKLLDDPQLAKQMGEAGRRRVAEHFGAEVYVERLRRAVEG